MDVTLVDFTQRPFEKLYTAYRTATSTYTPQELWRETAFGVITPDAMREFVKCRMKTGHTSPLEQVSMTFAISDVSRALSHQLVRYRVGFSPVQQSQRYVKYACTIPFVVPDTVKRDSVVYGHYTDLMRQSAEFYRFALAQGVPAEDARYGLLIAAPTNLQVVINFAELLHIADQRLCLRAQWEFQELVRRMRREIKQKMSRDLGLMLQPKCMASRLAYCDEDGRSYLKCLLARTRPHKSRVVNYL